ncbi:acid phosphatase det1 [Maudiozyma exigua]|uniref:Acid phosphatase det1 n=1 Tax=Maudiozyma exigua TaxID=34358 RepID=A0A9P6WCM4_MAUEX|nr:acid phosphatase det1 [Kazachstania exigua]
MQKTNHYLSEMSHENTGMPQQHPMFQQQQSQQPNQQQQQQQRQMTQGQRTSYDSNVNSMVNPVPISFSEKVPSFEDPVTMRARLKLDYMKSFQDDSHFYPEFPSYQNVTKNQYSSHLPMNNFNNIQLQQQQQQQTMFANEQQNNIFNRSTTPTNNANYLNQKQYGQKLSDRENLLSLLAQKSLEKQQFQHQQQQQQQQQYPKQTKRPNSQHYYQHQQQGDPYLVN